MMVSGESGNVKNQVYNPYLPLTTYIPDGEPHVFGDRVYIYGSHDAEGNEVCGVLDLAFDEETWTVNKLTCSFSEGKHALYFGFRGEGKLEFRTFGFIG